MIHRIVLSLCEKEGVRPFAIACFVAASLPLFAASPVRVLFLGNSYTYYNNLPAMLTALSGGSIEASMVTLGGATLMDLWLKTPALATLRGGEWDYVVLQDQSTLGFSYTDTRWGVNAPSASHRWARFWDDEIKQRKARTVFYLTWARKEYPQFQTDLNYAYISIARERNALLAPVGLAWKRVREEHPSINLFDSDGSHPAPLGTYLTACVFLETLAGRNCQNAPTEVIGHPMVGSMPDLSRMATLVRMMPEEHGILASAASAAVRESGRGAFVSLAAREQAASRLLPRPTPASDTEWSGIWRGPARLYRAPATATLSLQATAGTCQGALTVSHSQTGAQHSLPLSNCSIREGILRFETQDPRFIQESFQAVLSEGVLVGRSQLESADGYQRLSGSFELRKE